MAGVPIGLSDVYYVKMTDDQPGGTTTYEATPKRLAGAITANINPNASLETLFADNGPFDAAASLGQIEVELSVADIPLEAQADLLGHAPPVKGILERKASDTPPWIALGFRALKSNGKYRYVWLLKGKFSQPEQNHETKGESVSFQPPTIRGSFVQRESDGKWQRVADEDAPDFDPSIVTGWFTDPDFEPTT